MNILVALFIAYFSWKWWNTIIEIYYDFNKIFVLYFETTKMLIFGVCFILYYLNLSGKNGFQRLHKLSLSSLKQVRLAEYQQVSYKKKYQCGP